MGAIAKRRIAGKTAWRNLNVRTARAEAFAWIEVITLLYKSGRFASRQEAMELLITRVTKDDLRWYRKLKQANPEPVS